MTTSSDQRTPDALLAHGDHWLELTATLCRESTEEFSEWLSGELESMEQRLDSYVSPRSLQKSLGRQADSVS